MNVHYRIYATHTHTHARPPCMPQIARDLEVGDTSGSISLMRAREPGTAVSRIMTVVVRTGRATRPVLERTLELMKKMDCM